MYRHKSIIQGIIAGILFGTASIFTRFLTVYGVDIYLIALGRLSVAAIFSFIFISRTIKDVFNQVFKHSITRATIHITLGILLGFHFILFTAGVRDTSIANATILVNTVPIQSLVILALIRSKEIDKIDYIVVTTAFVGSVLIALPNIGTSRLLGDVESFLAASMLAFYLIIGKRMRVKLDPYSSMPFIYLFATLTILITLTSLYSGLPSQNLETNFDIIISLLGLGLLPTWIGHTLFYSSLEYLKPHETAILGLLEPVGATILAYAIFSEIPHPYVYMGGILIGISIYLLSIKRG